MKCIFVHIYISIQDKTTIENILDFEKTFYFIPDSRKYKNKVDTTNRCEALKEVMSLNYDQY